MNHREPPHLSAGARRALRSLSLLLLPALTSEIAPALARQQTVAGQEQDAPRSASLPYLTVVGAPALRFQRSTPPPDLVTRPAAAAPPVPPLTPTEATVALANAAAAQSAARTARAHDEVPVTEIKVETPPPAAPAKPTPKAILPDDARPAVRPEDFLPYFQVPGSARQTGEVNVVVPVPAPANNGSIPVAPSTATYTQSPK